MAKSICEGVSERNEKGSEKTASTAEERANDSHRRQRSDSTKLCSCKGHHSRCNGEQMRERGRQAVPLLVVGSQRRQTGDTALPAPILCPFISFPATFLCLKGQSEIKQSACGQQGDGEDSGQQKHQQEQKH